MQDHVLRPRQAFDFGDEVTIGGRDAVSSSSAFVSDRLGSLSYHKSDHPTLNAAAELGPTSTPPTAVLLRGHRACRRGDLSADLATSPYYRTDTNRAMGEGVLRAAVLLVRLAPPVTVSPRYAGGLLSFMHELHAGALTHRCLPYVRSCGTTCPLPVPRARVPSTVYSVLGLNLSSWSQYKTVFCQAAEHVRVLGELGFRRRSSLQRGSPLEVRGRLPELRR